MSFLTPFMLWGALAASIPVAIHFFFRSRYRTVPWAAMKFLLTSVEQTSRRLKFQELLLLLLRMTVLVMLAIAFARPFTSMVRGTGRGDSVDAVFVMDVSYSMGAKDGTKTRMERAREEAIKIIDELPAHSTVQIITTAGNDKTLIGPRSPANLDQAKKLLQDLDVTQLATNLAPGITEAQGVLKRGQASNKELYLFSDMQANGFDPQANEVKQTLQEIKEKTHIHLVRCGTRTLKNAAVVGITSPSSGVPRPNERATYAVLVRNTGTEELENLDVTLEVDGDDKNLEHATIAKLPARQTVAVLLRAKAESAGLHVLTAKVHADDLEADNRFDQVILIRAQVNVLVVDGNYFSGASADKSSSYLLMEALLPQVQEADKRAFYVQPRVVSARDASPALLAKQDVCILTNVALQAKAGKLKDLLPAGFLEALDKFVREGHGLIIFAGDNVDPVAYDEVLGKKLGLLPLPIKSVVKKAPKEMLFMNRSTFSDAPPAFWVFKDDPRYEAFDGVPVWQYLDVDETHKDDNLISVVLRLGNNQPLVTAKKVGAGEVLFVGTASDAPFFYEKSLQRTWTIWPRTNLYVPFLHVSVNYLLRGQTQTYNLKAGETLNWFTTDTHDDVYNLYYPNGKVTRLGHAEKLDNRKIVRVKDLPLAGIYRMVGMPPGSESSGTTEILNAVKSGTPIAVIPDLRESEDLSTLTDAQLDEYLGFQPVHIVAGDASSSVTGADRLNREWTVWALLAVLFLVLGETLLAWWSGRAW